MEDISLWKNIAFNPDSWIVFFEGKQGKPAAITRLESALRDFQEFKIAYLDYVGKIVEGNAIGLPPRQWIGAHALEALDKYWLTLSRVAEQYQGTLYRELLVGDPAEEKVKTYLGTLQKLGFSNADQLNVLLYFDKLSETRRYAFTDQAFVALPYRLHIFDPELLWMAIPHELGHVVYWNLDPIQPVDSPTQKEHIADMLRERLCAKLEAENQDDRILLQRFIDQYLLNWIEETYADVIGTLLGGRNYLESTRLILDWEHKEDRDWVKNDYRHPVPCLRLFSIYHILHLTDAASYSDTAEQFIKKTIPEALNQRINLLKIPNAPLVIPDNIGKMLKQDMANLLQNFAGVFDKNPETLTVSQLLPYMRTMVECINELVHRENDPKPLNLPAQGGKAFDELTAVAQQRGGNQIQEVAAQLDQLLNPVILTGQYDYRHTHDLLNADIAPDVPNGKSHNPWHPQLDHFH